MKTKTILAALVLSLAPAIASASCRDGHAQTSSCQPGTTWDAETASCVTDPIG